MTDWKSHKESINHPAVPTGQDFVNLNNALIKELPQYLKSRDKEIFSKRIAVEYSKQHTLKELGNKFGISRERIRQLEVKLLKKLSACIFHNKIIPRNYEIIINPNYTHWWQLTAEEFKEDEIINLDTFIQKLSQIWKVSEMEIIPQIPLVVNIFTQSTTSTLNRNISEKNHVSQAALINADIKTQETKLNKLRFKRHKHITSLIKIGINKITDIHNIWPLEKSTASSSIVNHLNEIQEKAMSHNEIDWHKYKNLLNLKVLPSITSKNDEHFLKSLEASIAEIIHALPLSKRVPSRNNPYKWKTQLDRIKIIFSHRAALPRTKRQTLCEVSSIIYGTGNNGPSIARDEKIYLKMLNSALVQKNYILLDCWLDECFCIYIKKFNNIFNESDNDYDKFINLIRDKTKNQHLDPIIGIPILWAIFYGHPPDRYFHLKKDHYKKVVDNSNPDVIPQKIKLTGFRNTY